MAQGIFTRERKRFKTKKALKEAVKSGEDVILEATSIFGGEYSGLLSTAEPQVFTIVGPNPYRDRSWYANIKPAKKGGWKVT